MAQLVKNPPAMWETWVRSRGWEDPLEKAEVTPLQYSGPGELHGLYSPWGRKEADRLSDFHLHCLSGAGSSDLDAKPPWDSPALPAPNRKGASRHCLDRHCLDPCRPVSTTRGFSRGCTGLKSLGNQRLKARRRLSKTGFRVFCRANRTGTGNSGVMLKIIS